ncbi:Glycerol uptake facilitator and related permeases (Major Intrinsic Protein Family) [Rubrobacter radiotolerans]|uniref:Aquaporin n=1 Tax=Rubrobacter radiotolerans TaxID=42256 RepID=A0A023X5K3_RUBRA|nr:aquaporin [Rubrobacter radiotolerans]AHY47752.1 Glycerol uptake facilitator and related permeases (Major Intrinsic Protein Family) [Rubrobacter radiotolerans]MDX5895228.1 aquaporin [Rubrobacter radiotolerans]SMC07682.1 glycerol uptake facilitator protein [Rubrobacter radiotolerans DSM 5868]
MENVALWKRLVAEFVGVFLLCSIGLMLVATSITTGAFGLFELGIAFALAIMVCLIVVAAVSGGQINPAITVALAVYGRFPWREVPLYIAAQVSGGVAGAFVLYLIYRGPIVAFEEANNIVRGEPGSEITAMIFACFAPNPAIAAAQDPPWTPDIISLPGALGAEFFATFVLALVVFAAIENRNAFAPSVPIFALILGLVVGFIVIAEAPLTMAAINPARDLGPRIAIYFLGWGQMAFPGIGNAPWWIWTVGPTLGAVAGGGAWVFLLGRWLTARPEAPEAAGTEAEELEVPTPGGDPGTTSVSERGR